MKTISLRAVLVAALCFQIVAAGAPPSLLPEDGMFHLYENNRRTKTPNFITTDFILLAYSMILQQSLVESEQQQSYPELRQAIHGLSEVSISNKGVESESSAAKSNRQFIEVLMALIDGSDPVAPAKEVSRELGFIRAAGGIGQSPIFEEKLDYSQFRPRGIYTRSPELSRYFQTVRYATSIGFFIQESAATGITAGQADKLSRQALMLAQWMDHTPALRDHFRHLEDRQAWLFGPPDDLTSADLLKTPPAATEATADWRKKLLEQARHEGHQPSIFSGIVDVTKLDQGITVRDAMTAWRFLPGSFTPDAAAQQQLIYNRVGRFLGKGTPVSATVVNGVPVKGFPLAIEVMGLLGSAEALHQLDSSEEVSYERYAAAREAAVQQIAKPGGLPAENMALLKAVLTGASPSSAAEQLQTALGFWTLYRHSGVLYTKQSYTSVGKGIQISDDRKSAWLEPSPQVYKVLAQMSNQLHARLGLTSFQSLSSLLDTCIQISADEAAGHALTAEQVTFLNGLDRDLLQLAGSPDQPIAVDVHTDPNSGQVLTEGILFPAEAKHQNQRGARFRTSEFKVPMAERLTDEAWQQKLLKEAKPR